MEELAWYRQLGAAVHNKVIGHTKTQDQLKERDREEPHQWHYFELAEAMEQGLCKELTSSYIEAPKGDGERRLRVQRSKDRREFTLTSRDRHPLLVAYADRESSHYKIYIPSNGEPPCAFGPAFVLSSTAKDQWTLTSTKCEHCEWHAKRQHGTRTLANFFHYKEQVGVGQALCMDLELPEIGERNSTTVWCPVCGDATKQGKIELTTRRPKWNRKIGSLTLDFAGRCSLSSAKNFQFEMPEKPECFCLLFGKVKEHEFVLDFKAPLGMVQAFAAALTTSNWR